MRRVETTTGVEWIMEPGDRVWLGTPHDSEALSIEAKEPGVLRGLGAAGVLTVRGMSPIAVAPYASNTIGVSVKDED